MRCWTPERRGACPRDFRGHAIIIARTKDYDTKFHDKEVHMQIIKLY